jgi:hypothetical protein
MHVSVDAKVMVDGKPAEGEFLMADGSTIKVEKIVTQILVMEAEVPVDAPVDVTNEAVAIEVDEVEVKMLMLMMQFGLSNKVIELQAIIH